MEPTLLDGELVIARAAGKGRAVRTGDIVCIRRPGELLMIKRLGPGDASGGYLLSGDGAASAPAIDLGVVSVSHIIARAVARIPVGGLRIVPLSRRRP